MSLNEVKCIYPIFASRAGSMHTTRDFRSNVRPVLLQLLLQAVVHHGMQTIGPPAAKRDLTMLVQVTAPDPPVHPYRGIRM